MRTSVLTAIVILLVSSVAAVLANSLWYKMPWLRPSIASVKTGGQAEADRNVEERPAPNGDDATKAGFETPTAADHTTEAEGGWVLIDEVLEDLANGTAFFIDAREAGDYAEGHLRGAVHLPSSAIYENIDSVYNQGVDIQGKVVVYCGGGDCEASHNVADALQRDFRFTNVLIYKSGWEEVESSGRFGEFVETGAAP